MQMEPFSVDNIKGWTRATCVAFIALAMGEVDLSDAAMHSKLIPLHRVLDKAWLLPMHVPSQQLRSLTFLVVAFI